MAAEPDSRERRFSKRSARLPASHALFSTRPLARLCFTSGGTQRFVSSVPNGWMHFSDEELEDLMAYARDR